VEGVARFRAAVRIERTRAKWSSGAVSLRTAYRVRSAAFESGVPRVLFCMCPMKTAGYRLPPAVYGSVCYALFSPML
jgi:hypothetical protein